MKIKGFTLVELLAVIVIVAIILVIAIPRVLKAIEKVKDSAYESQIELILDTVDNYIVLYNRELTITENEIVITLRDLHEKNMLPNPLTNPRGGIFDRDNTKIIVTIEDNHYNLEFFVE